VDEDAVAVLARLEQAMRAKDIDATMACWHPDVEARHMLRPDRSWHGAETYRELQSRIWDANPSNRDEIVSSGAAGNLIFFETVTHHTDGSAIPCITIMEIEGGRIRRARVYTDVPRHDGMSMDNWVEDMNA
jgi:hypothetical protein